VPYTLTYHPKVVDEDLAAIPLNMQCRIARAIEARLGSAPEQYGEPLRGTLKGYWKLRIGDYRAVYKIVGTEVWIFGILHRRRIYTDVLRRIGQHPP
jgi:mRNA interferase RelE/StbE